MNQCLMNFNFQNLSSALGNGNTLSIGDGYKAMNVEIVNVNANTINFEGQSNYGGIWSPIICVRLSDLNLAISTIGNGEIWSADLTGLLYFRCRISNYISGTVTVNGRVVN